MQEVNICLEDPLFFIPNNERRDFSQPFSLPLPKEWSEMREKEWTNVYPLNTTIQRQGWKVHISSEQCKAEEVLKKTAEVCFQQEVVFKHLSTIDAFKNRNGKLMDRGFAGKFITCYPNEENLELFLNLLEEQLSDFKGPYILSDKRWKKAPIYLRYGVFRKSSSTDNIEMLTIDNKQVKDERLPQFVVPEGVDIPFFLSDWVNKQADNEQIELPFKIETAIRFSNSGGIYTARLNESGKKVILKEARPFTGLDNEGIYSCERIESENRALNILELVEGVPRNYWYGQVWEHSYLAVEYIEGIPLNRWVTNNFPLYVNRDNHYLSRALSLINQLVEIIKQAHQLDVYHQDIHLGNIMVDKNDKICLIDWEQSIFDNAKEVSHQIAAPGFRAWGINSPSKIDWYGISQVAHYLFYPLIIQSDLVYEYCLQTQEAGLRLYSELAENTYDINSYLKLLNLIQDEVNVVSSVSPKKLLHPYLKKQNSIESQTLSVLGEKLIAGVSEVLRNWHYPYRFFPVNYYGVLENQGIAYSDLGIIWAYTKLLHATGQEQTQEFIQIKTKLMTDSVSSIRMGNFEKNGLFDGCVGTLWLLSELGMVSEAVALFSQYFESMITDTKSCKMYDGLAGILLVGLSFSSQNLLSQELEKRVLTVLEEFSESYKSNPDAFIQIGPGKKETNNPYGQESGLLYGHAGLGWLFAEAAKLTNNHLFIDSLNLSIANELEGYVSDEIDSLQYVQGGRVLPYFSMGSAGLGVLIAANKKFIKSEHLKSLNNIYKALDANLCVFPGLFNGFTGLKLGQFLINKEIQVLSEEKIIESFYEGLTTYLIKFGSGFCIAGDSGMRITMDITSGFGGIALALSSFLEDNFCLLPQVKIIGNE